MTPLKPLRILIVDDHAIVREGLAALIGRQPDMEVAAEAENGLSALEMYVYVRPDVVLMDLHLPLMDGVGAINRICALDATAAILALTAYDSDEYIYRAVQAGARGYILKNIPGVELLTAIRRVAAGERFIPFSIGARLSRRMMQQTLTPRELSVLACMAQGNSNEDVGRILGLTTGTVKCYVHKILSKLRVKDRTAAVAEAFRQGIVCVESECN